MLPIAHSVANSRDKKNADDKKLHITMATRQYSLWYKDSTRLKPLQCLHRDSDPSLLLESVLLFWFVFFLVCMFSVHTRYLMKLDILGAQLVHQKKGRGPGQTHKTSRMLTTRLARRHRYFTTLQSSNAPTPSERGKRVFFYS